VKNFLEYKGRFFTPFLLPSKIDFIPVSVEFGRKREDAG